MSINDPSNPSLMFSGNGRLLRPEDVDLKSIDAKTVDNLLSRDLEQMSFKERANIQEEVHGVAVMCPDETPEYVQESLTRLAVELDLIRDKPAYEEALMYDKTYIHEDDFRLTLSRAEVHKTGQRGKRGAKECSAESFFSFNEAAC